MTPANANDSERKEIGRLVNLDRKADPDWPAGSAVTLTRSANGMWTAEADIEGKRHRVVAKGPKRAVKALEFLWRMARVLKSRRARDDA